MSAPARSREAALLECGCRELGIDATAGDRERLLDFLDLVYLWNRSAGLTTIPREDAVRLHLLDSLAALPLVGGPDCIDLGAGGGFPGLPLAIVRDDLRFSLAESNRRKCSFLHEAIRRLGIRNAAVLEGDVDSVSGGFATVMSRAFRPPLGFLRTGRRLVNELGRVLALLAAQDDEELAELARESDLVVDQVRRLRLPAGGEPRTIVSFHRP